MVFGVIWRKKNDENFGAVWKTARTILVGISIKEMPTREKNKQEVKLKKKMRNCHEDIAGKETSRQLATMDKLKEMCIWYLIFLIY